MKPDIPRAQIKSILDIPNVGKACMADFALLDIHLPQELIGLDPYDLYDKLCLVTGVRQDPCVYDVLISAIRYMEGSPAMPWWNYTAERKAHLLAKAK